VGTPAQGQGALRPRRGVQGQPLHPACQGVTANR
jgi:hypothetical protein